MDNIFTEKATRPSRNPDRYLYSTKYQFSDSDENILDVIASSGLINRLDEIVDVRGGRYENYLKNPVVLWSHDWDGLPIARTIEHIVGDDLRHRIEFSPTEEAQKIKTLYKLGFLNAWSIGFIIFDYKNEDFEGKRIRRVTDWEELELSGVVIPADANALTATLSLPRSIELPIELRGAISYKKTPLADEGEDWNAAREVAGVSVEDLKIMCAWYDAEYPNVKSSYKLPHHKADGEHACVWRAVATAGAVLMGGRGGIDIPDSDVAGVKAHIEKHYHDFDKVAPWESDASIDEDWHAIAKRMRNLTSEIYKPRTIGDTELAMLDELARHAITLMATGTEDVALAANFFIDALKYENNEKVWRDFIREFGAKHNIWHSEDERFKSLIATLENVKSRVLRTS
jgi:hypothetical protein